MGRLGQLELRRKQLLPEPLNSAGRERGEETPPTPSLHTPHVLLGWQPVAREQASQGREGEGPERGGEEWPVQKTQIPALWATGSRWRARINKQVTVHQVAMGAIPEAKG